MIVTGTRPATSSSVTRSAVLARQVDRAADGRVPGEGDLGGRKEDAHLGGMGGVVGRLDEDRLAEVELPRDGLHLRGSLSPSASSTMASGLPVKGVDVKTS
jgi:hypothetical protein